METEALYALRDVAGVPSHPIIFLVLGVLTFALHILAVQVMLGASALTLWGAFSSAEHKRRLAAAMINVAKVAVSVAVVIGVAPLLFVQVIYDPFWYTSNVLSAWWVIGFIAILTVAYLLMYVFYFKNHHLVAEKTRCPGSMIASVLLMLVVGFIMHTLTNQMLSPDQWMQWYAPNGVIDASGTGLHSFNLFRFAFFISLSGTVVGGWLLAYRHYISMRVDSDEAYLSWLQGLGNRLVEIGAAVSLLLGVLWMASLPENQSTFIATPWPYLAAVMLLVAGLFPRLLKSAANSLWVGYGSFAVLAVAGIVIASARELLRWGVLSGEFGYNALDYSINMDWYSTSLFFITFAGLGGIVLSYLLTVAWKSGQSEGVYTPSPAVSRLGDVAIGAIILWIVHFFALGFWVWAS